MSSGRKSSSSSLKNSSSSLKPNSSPHHSASSANSLSKEDSSPKAKSKHHKHLRVKKLSKQHSSSEQQPIIDTTGNDNVFEIAQYNSATSQKEMTNGGADHCIDCEKSMKEAFDFFDIDRDGRITSDELHQVLRFLDSPATSEEVNIMIKDADSDGNGTVEFNEFLKLMNRYEKHNHARSADDEMREAFKVFDHNGDSYIDFDEIKQTMCRLGESVSDEDVNAMINEADTDHDGRINFEEFKQMMTLMRKKVGIVGFGEQLVM